MNTLLLYGWHSNHKLQKEQRTKVSVFILYELCLLQLPEIKKTTENQIDMKNYNLTQGQKLMKVLLV
jgi:hypothetical protein